MNADSWRLGFPPHPHSVYLGENHRCQWMEKGPSDWSVRKPACDASPECTFVVMIYLFAFYRQYVYYVWIVGWCGPGHQANPYIFGEKGCGAPVAAVNEVAVGGRWNHHVHAQKRKWGWFMRKFVVGNVSSQLCKKYRMWRRTLYDGTVCCIGIICLVSAYGLYYFKPSFS